MKIEDYDLNTIESNILKIQYKFSNPETGVRCPKRDKIIFEEWQVANIHNILSRTYDLLEDIRMGIR